MLAAAVGAALGAGIVLFDTGATAGSRRFIDTPAFWVWLTLICAQTALFAVVLVPLGRLVGALQDAFFPLPAPDAESWQGVYSKRKTMGEVLELQVTGGQASCRP